MVPQHQTRMLLAYVIVLVLQRELDTFKKTVWNTHRIRPQKDTVLPNGIPNHIYGFPEEYGLEQCGFSLTEEQLQEAAEVSDVLKCPEDFLEPLFRRECERLIPNVENIKAKNCKQAYLYLRHHFSFH